MKHFLKYIISSLILVLIQQNIQSQDTLGFQRAYFGDNSDIVNYDNVPLPDGGFCLVNTRRDAEDLEYFINVSRHNPKGNISWTMDYFIEDLNFQLQNRSITAELLSNNEIFITSLLSLEEDSISSEKLMFKIEIGAGTIVWSNTVQDSQDGIDDVATYPSTTVDLINRINVYTSHKNDSVGIHYNNYTIDDTLRSSNTYVVTDTLDNLYSAIVRDAASSIDSTNAVMFRLNEYSSGVIKFDINGSPLFATKYSASIDSMNGTYEQYALTPTIDTGYVMLGHAVDSLSQISNVVTKIDKLGNIQWSKTIESTFAFSVKVNDVLVTSANEIMVTAKYSALGEAGDMSIFLDMDGNVLRQYDYASDNSLYILSPFTMDASEYLWGQSKNTMDGGILYTTSGLDRATETTGSYAIVMDSIGQARCNDTLEMSIVSDFTLLRDTMLVQTSNFAITDTIELESQTFEYNTPVLMLLDTTFCPQDTVVALLEAFVDGATAYEWSTGETTETITVTEVGEYSVTVTVDDKVCYMLCDTSNIIQLEFPEAQVIVDDSFLCQQDFIRITSGLTAGAGAREYIWASGEETRSLDITGPGDYSVTITDNCNNTAEASVTLTAADFSQDFNVDVIADISQVCLEGNIILTANASSPAIDYTWSNGESGRTIVVTEPGSYTVTVTDICEEMREATIDVSDTQFELPDLNIGIQAGELDCEDGLLLRIDNISNSRIASYAWSTSAVTDTTRIFTPGEYSVTVTDVCGTTATAVSTIESGELNTLEYPNIFFPNSNIDINKSFGPHIECPELFDGEDYSLEIFNRWGNKVFESDRVNLRWNGRINNMGSLIQEDVYLFVYSYTDVNNAEIKGNGSVTLSR